MVKVFSDDRTDWKLLTVPANPLCPLHLVFEQMVGTDKTPNKNMGNKQKGYEMDHVHKHHKFLSRSKGKLQAKSKEEYT